MLTMPKVMTPFQIERGTIEDGKQDSRQEMAYE
jgi:hypothetical protein